MVKTQTLSFPIRLPDPMQTEALRLLDASREAINQILLGLWPKLDVFATDRSGPAWKQVERHLLIRSGHGSRQERCEMEQAGRLLRAQASRKQLFDALLPLLSEGLIRPKTEKHPAQKDYARIKEEVQAFRAAQKEMGDEQDAFVAMTNVLEQACNVSLKEDAFPTSYDQMQHPPVLSVGCLTFAGDDGMKLGQTYRARIDLTVSCELSTRQESHRGTLARIAGKGHCYCCQCKGSTPCPLQGKQVYYAGWMHSIKLCTSQTTQTLSFLSTSQLRKRLLLRT